MLLEEKTDLILNMKINLHAQFRFTMEITYCSRENDFVNQQMRRKKIVVLDEHWLYVKGCAEEAHIESW